MFKVAYICNKKIMLLSAEMNVSNFTWRWYYNSQS